MSAATSDVDTHARQHVAALIDSLGRLLARVFPVSQAGYGELLRWVQEHGTARRAGVEGTGPYGAGLARFLIAQGIETIEVTRPNRRRRRYLARVTPVTPRQRLSVFSLEAPRHSQRLTAAWSRPHCWSRRQVAAETDREPASSAATPGVRALEPMGALATAAAVTALRSLARRCQQLEDEITSLDEQLKVLISQAAPRLLSPAWDRTRERRPPAGTDWRQWRATTSRSGTGSALWREPGGRLKRQDHPTSTQSGRRSSRQLRPLAEGHNNRMIHHPETRDYVARRTAEGLSRKEIRHCLMRRLVRQLYTLLLRDLKDVSQLCLR